MPNKLLIKANFCDLRNVKEETLAALKCGPMWWC